MTKQRAALVALVLMVSLIVPASGEVFYDARLREGKAALESNRASDAVDQLKIACFGMLHDPKGLSEGLAWLAVAQNAAGRPTELETTLNRFVEVQSRFAAYNPSVIDQKIR